MIKIVIGGCRDFNDYPFFCKHTDRILSRLREQDTLCILSGTCSGVDLMGERYAAERGYEVERHPANWKAYGRAAGPKRNEEMVLAADYVIAFWDGVSRGTKTLIQFAEKHGRQIRVVHLDKA